MLVGDVGVVARGGEPAGASSKTIEIVFTEINGVEFDVIFDMGANGLQAPSSVRETPI